MSAPQALSPTLQAESGAVVAYKNAMRRHRTPTISGTGTDGSLSSPMVIRIPRAKIMWSSALVKAQKSRKMRAILRKLIKKQRYSMQSQAASSLAQQQPSRGPTIFLTYPSVRGETHRQSMMLHKGPAPSDNLQVSDTNAKNLRWSLPAVQHVHERPPSPTMASISSADAADLPQDWEYRRPISSVYSTSSSRAASVRSSELAGVNPRKIRRAYELSMQGLPKLIETKQDTEDRIDGVRMPKRKPESHQESCIKPLFHKPALNYIPRTGSIGQRLTWKLEQCRGDGVPLSPPQASCEGTLRVLQGGDRVPGPSASSEPGREDALQALEGRPHGHATAPASDRPTHMNEPTTQTVGSMRRTSHPPSLLPAPHARHSTYDPYRLDFSPDVPDISFSPKSNDKGKAPADPFYTQTLARVKQSAEAKAARRAKRLSRIHDHGDLDAMSRSSSSSGHRTTIRFEDRQTLRPLPGASAHRADPATPPRRPIRREESYTQPRTPPPVPRRSGAHVKDSPHPSETAPEPVATGCVPVSSAGSSPPSRASVLTARTMRGKGFREVVVKMIKKDW